MKTQPKLLSREDISLGIVCPMANEAGSAIPLIRQVLEKCKGVKSVRFYAVLDSVSRDGTRDLLLDYAQQEPHLRVIWAPENTCVVDAYVRGYREAIEGSHDYILEMDAGFSHRPEDIENFLSSMEEGYDCVFGSRFMPGGGIISSSFKRRIFSRGGSILTNILVGTRLKDMTSGFELFSRHSLEMVLDRGIRSRAHFFQTEIKYYCRDLKIKEVPIIYSTDSVAVGNAAVGDAFRNLWRLCTLHWFGEDGNR